MNWILTGSVFLLGLVIGLGIVVIAMRNLMMVEKKVEGEFEEVCEKLEETIKSTMGWGMPIDPLDIGAELADKGHKLDNVRKMKNYYLCKAPYAARILDQFPFISAMMPCSWAVYEKQNGEVYIARMNIPLMSKIFFGNVIGSTMAKVGEEEEEMAEEFLE